MIVELARLFPFSSSSSSSPSLLTIRQSSVRFRGGKRTEIRISCSTIISFLFEFLPRHRNFDPSSDGEAMKLKTLVDPSVAAVVFGERLVRFSLLPPKGFVVESLTISSLMNQSTFAFG